MMLRRDWEGGRAKTADSNEDTCGFLIRTKASELGQPPGRDAPSSKIWIETKASTSSGPNAPGSDSRRGRIGTAPSPQPSTDDVKTRLGRGASKNRRLK